MKAFLILQFSILILLTNGCTDDPQPSLEYKSQGYIKGTITGTSLDESYTFNDKFRYNQYLIQELSTYTYLPESDRYYFTISRSDFNNSSAFKFYFFLDDLADATPEDVTYFFEFKKELKDKIVTFGIYSTFFGVDDPGEIMKISDFSFDESTGRAKGKYTVTADNNTTGKNATVSGDFDITLKKIIR